ncbi:MAG: ABC transporter ATP-binding protein [Eubacteriales bacterium]|jgi:ATP-binding cassette subfamily B protein AbcA/BmrA
MKKQNEKIKPNTQHNKVSLIKCLSIFNNIKLPWTLLVIGLVFTIFSAWASLTTVTFAGDAVDASGEIPTAELVKYLVATFTALAFAVTSGICNGLAHVKIQYLLRNKLWHKIIVTKQKSYDLDGGESLVSRVTSDCEFASKFFSTVSEIIKVVIGSVMYFVQLYFINKRITTWVLIFIPISSILGFVYSMARFAVALRTQSKLADSTAYLAERTKDMNLIKTCNAQEQELAKGREYFREQYKAQLRVGYTSMFQTVIGTVMEVIGKVIPFAIGAVIVANGEITVGILVTVNTLFGSITGVFGELILKSGDFKEANGALTRIVHFFEEEEEHFEDGIILEEESQEDIIFDRVEFGYTNEKVLKNFSTSIPRGKVTAIIGRNGSGKSTVFKLLTRLYEPDDGTICFGENDVATYTLHSWRKKICLVAQGSPMMAGTIRDNICYGRDDDVSEEELICIATLAHVYHFVKDLPDGFDSEVTAGGGNFSGGQRQCIAIARAMMSGAEYLLLDESTSNLDAKRERDVMEAMLELMKEKTTVIIAHSLSTIRNADHIIVLNNGEIEAEGSPAQIIKQTGNYLEKMMNRKRPALVAGNQA